MYAGKIVEQAPAAELFARPLHPYTIGLLAARPEHRSGSGEPLAAIPGMVPQPRDFPAGCRFHPRCPFAREPRCTAEPPELRALAPNHLVRCHHAEELGPPREGLTR